jgi:hypothetical protein
MDWPADKVILSANFVRKLAGEINPLADSGESLANVVG